MRLLYFASLSHGGLADYAREQAAALARAGHEVELLCGPSFPSLGPSVRRAATLSDPARAGDGGGGLSRAWRFFRLMHGHHRALARVVRRNAHAFVLLGAYAEYFSPLWSPALRRLARAGVVFGAIVHDPVRDAVLGPPAWHRRSIAGGYSFLRHAFVHEAVPLDTGRPMPGLKVTVVPHGPYSFDTPVPGAAEARRKLGLPPGVPVLLAFGHIRDNKNLDLVVRSLPAIPDLHLLVAGRELSSGQKSSSWYRELAGQLGVAGRCHWHVRFIAEHEIGTFFAAADYLALTYGAGFRSASGVLSASSQFRKPCLASSGAGPLRTLVRRYGLGVWVEPDDRGALEEGLRRLLGANPQPRWDDYLRENSWEENARIVAETLAERN